MITKKRLLLIILLLPLIVLAAGNKDKKVADTIQPEPIEMIQSEPTHETEWLGYRTITAYSSTIDQTDDTPFITANGTKVRRGIVATNELPFGQELMIEGIEGIFVVADRTNKRYKFRIDIWMPTREEALQFGRQTREITLIN